MKVAFFDTHDFEKPVFNNENKQYSFDIDFLDSRLNTKTAALAQGADAVCSFVNDKVDRPCLEKLASQGIKMIALRSAGFNHVDLQAANELDITVARVPGYSPHAVAEYTIGMLLNLNRKIHKSYLRVRELNFSLHGLVGFDLHGKTVGVIGTGKIGSIVAKILTAFGCEVLCYDISPNPELKDVSYVDIKELCKKSDVITLHVPLTPETDHLLNEEMFALMKPGVFIINTGRGALIDTVALIKALKKEHIGGAALDDYEEEESVFFQDVSDRVLQDDILARLLTFPNVLITSHQAFLTQEALGNIAHTTLENISQFAKTGKVSAETLVNSTNNLQ